MAWIESNQELARHPKAKKAARMLGISVPAIVGHLHFLWWWCLEYAQDGDLSQFDDSDIADAAGWEGDAKQFVRALLDCGPGESFGFLEQSKDGGILIHDWMDYAGRLIEKRQANTDRMRKARAKHVQRTCNERAGATVPNRTVPNSTVPVNNNNAREEIEINVSESEETVSKTGQAVTELSGIVSKTEDNHSMAIGTRAVDWAQKKWGRLISPGESEAIIAWCDEFSTRGSPDADAVVIEALKQCDNASVRNKFYLSTVLTDWREAGVLTVDHVLARDAERKKDYKRNKDPGDKAPMPPSGKYDNFYL